MNLRGAIHAGETTLGAIDNIYRHQITLASSLQFVALESNKLKVESLLGNTDHCFVSGALSLENLKSLNLLTLPLFKEKWAIDLNIKTVLVTVHPETVAFQENEKYAEEICLTLIELIKDYQIIITMPNADTYGSIFREKFEALKKENETKMFLIENFGTQSYFTAMKYVTFLLGNTSSGIIEAASFGKYVFNVGDRQKGREAGDNVIHVPFEKEIIVKKIRSQIKESIIILIKKKTDQKS